MISKTAREVTKTAMDYILKLGMDGFHIGRIHSDRGHEFSGDFRKWANSRGIVLTRTTGDDPRANGRVEVAAKSFKTQIRRLLKQADVGSECWPLAARYADEQKLAAWRRSKLSTFHAGRPCEASHMETECLRARRGDCQVPVSCS